MKTFNKKVMLLGSLLLVLLVGGYFVYRTVSEDAKREPASIDTVDSFVDVFDKLAKEKGISMPAALEKKAYEFSTIIKPDNIATFKMGSKSKKANRDEKPVHDVTLTRPFKMQRTEVTQLQWALVMGKNPSCFKEDGESFNIGGIDIKISYNRPVENVFYNDVPKFIKKLNKLDSKYEYSLPTEAKWEYAARGELKGVKEQRKVECQDNRFTACYEFKKKDNKEYSFGDDESKLDNYAWYKKNSEGTHDVALKKPNQYGLYDMHGNVWGWVYDWYNKKAYSAQDRYIDPKGPASGGSIRVIRGGSWFSNARYCRTSFRGNFWAGRASRNCSIGFRLVRTEK